MYVENSVATITCLKVSPVIVEVTFIPSKKCISNLGTTLLCTTDQKVSKQCICQLYEAKEHVNLTKLFIWMQALKMDR